MYAPGVWWICDPHLISGPPPSLAFKFLLWTREITVVREMEGGGDDKPVNGFEGPSGVELPTNLHGNFRVASTDQNLTQILSDIKSSKKPVCLRAISSPIFSLQRSLLFTFHIKILSILQAVINYGASWCRVCSQILPAFCHLSNKFPKLSFVYADIDECPETTLQIRYTPTFQFYRDGERVDEMFGAGEERLHDRLWLHS
ncbi:hypothetical protein SAY86_024982 [Trapa natans]|uniref:Thioredoxin domain-containing protein n=1 Tax=Trapa natans TaxID=22666 RepID=A0AAN7M7J7_TRANT|nr:hypothetical protein SAY86_024982 [Trapa natans]